MPLPSAPCAVEASMAMRQVVMESAMGMAMLARPLPVGDDFGVDVEGFGEVGATRGAARRPYLAEALLPWAAALSDGHAIEIQCSIGRWSRRCPRR